MPDSSSDDATLLAHLSAELDGVERALARLDAGDYGVCEICGESIEEDQLIGEPTLARCADHRG